MVKLWDLVLKMGHDGEREWLRVKGLTEEQKKVINNMMLGLAGYYAVWEEAKVDAIETETLVREETWGPGDTYREVRVQVDEPFKEGDKVKVRITKI